MKKIIFITLFSLLIIGSFAANSETTIEVSSTTNQMVSAGNLAENTVNVSSSFLILAPRTYSTACGTWTVTGTVTTPIQEKNFCDQACANGWSTWVYNSQPHTLSQY